MSATSCGFVPRNLRRMTIDSATYDGPERRDGDHAKDADCQHAEPELQAASA